MRSKKKLLFTIILDLVMALIFALLFHKMVFGGQTFHEVAGLALGAAVLIHIMFHRSWITGVTKKFFSHALPTEIRITYLVELLLLVCMGVSLVTGILISKVVFANLIAVPADLAGLHKSISYLALLFLGIHIGLSWRRAADMLKRLLRISGTNKIRRIAATLAAVALLAAGGYHIVSDGYFTEVASLTSSHTAYGESGNSLKQASGNTEAADETADTQGGGIEDIAAAEDGSRQGRMNRSGLAGGGGSAGVLFALYQSLSMIAAFAVATYYIDLFFRRRNPKNRNASR